MRSIRKTMVAAIPGRAFNATLGLRESAGPGARR
jgi:hypothetical protein